MKKNIRTALFWVFVLCGGLWLLNALFMPKYMSDIPEGALIAEYYKEGPRRGLYRRLRGL